VRESKIIDTFARTAGQKLRLKHSRRIIEEGLSGTREVFFESRLSKDAFVRGSPNGMQSTGCNVARLEQLQAARDIMVAPAGKEGGWKR